MSEAEVRHGGEESAHEVRRDGLHGVLPGREATIGSRGGRPEGRVDGRRRSSAGLNGRRGEVVPPVEFTSYYGRSVLKAPTWSARDIAGYFFLGGVAGGSALLAAGADATGRDAMRRSARLVAVGATGLSLAALVHDLGRPERFVHMLRVFKPTSPMSVGTWVLSGFTPLVALAAADEVRGMLPVSLRGRVPAAGLIGALGRPAGFVATVLAPVLSTYTAALMADTAVPVWHGGYREMPYLFGASAMEGAGGLVTALTPTAQAAPARIMGITGAVLDELVTDRYEKRLGMVGEPLQQGKAGRYMRVASWSTRIGAAALTVSAVRRSRLLDVAGGLALTVGSCATRFGLFHAGTVSATDPKYTVVPQRERLDGGRAGRD
jgi:hypothetical protein